MEELIVTQGSTVESLELDIKTLTQAISKRNEWLNNPDNRNKLTYQRTVIDTNEMSEELENLKNKLNDLK